MMSAVVPRPIAWISTVNENGSVNLAPFSNFTFLCHRAMMIGVGMGRKPYDLDQMKDSERNIRRTGEFVVNIASVKHLDQLHESSRDYPHDVSEVDVLGLELCESDRVSTPRLKDVGVSLECKLDQVLMIGLPEHRYHFFTAYTEVVHVAPGLFNDKGRIDTPLLDPLMRIGGGGYAGIGQIFDRTYLTTGYLDK